MEITKHFTTFIIYCLISTTTALFSQVEPQNIIIRKDSNSARFDTLKPLKPGLNNSQLPNSGYTDFEFLNQVVVIVNKQNATLKESTVGVSILKPYLIENKITTNLGTALEQVPGVTINDDQINIRSGSGWSYGAGSRVMVTIDEMPMITGDAGSVPFSFLPIEGISSVEVVKSAGSVLYGSSALNGVINLKSSPIYAKPSANISLFYGFYDIPNSLKISPKTKSIYGFNGIYSERIKQHSFAVSWNQLNDDGYRMSSQDYRIRMNWRYFYQTKKLPNLKLGLNGSVQKGESGSFLIWESNKLGYTTQDSALSKTLGQRLFIDPYIEYTGAKWKHKLQNRIFTVKNDIDNGNPNNNQDNQSQYYYSEWKSNRVISWGKSKHEIESKTTGQNNDQNSNIIENSPSKKRQLNLSLGAVNSLTNSQSALYEGNHQARNHAGYVQLSFKTKKLNLEAGSRYEYFNLDGKVRSKPVHRAGLNYQLSRSNSLRFSYGEGFRFPSMAELFTRTSTGNISVLPNPNLEPESSKSMELGFKQGFQLKKRGKNIAGLIDISVFNMDINNLMEYTFNSWKNTSGGIIPFDLGFKSVNIGEVNIRGAEIESMGKWELNNKGSKVEWLVGYTFALPTAKNPLDTIGYGFDGTREVPLIYKSTLSDTSSNFLKYRNRHTIRADVQWSNQKFQLGLSYRYETGFENIDQIFLQDIVVNGAKKQFEQGAISGHIFDVRMGYQLSPSFRINYLIRNTTQQIFMGRPADMSAPRMHQIQLNYRF